MGQRQRRPYDRKTIKIWLPRGVHKAFDGWCEAAGNTMQYAARTLIEKAVNYRGSTLEEVMTQEHSRQAEVPRAAGSPDPARLPPTALETRNGWRRAAGLPAQTQEEADAQDRQDALDLAAQERREMLSAMQYEYEGLTGRHRAPREMSDEEAIAKLRQQEREPDWVPEEERV